MDVVLVLQQPPQPAGAEFCQAVATRILGLSQAAGGVQANSELRLMNSLNWRRVKRASAVSRARL